VFSVGVVSLASMWARATSAGLRGRGDGVTTGILFGGRRRRRRLLPTGSTGTIGKRFSSNRRIVSFGSR